MSKPVAIVIALLVAVGTSQMAQAEPCYLNEFDIDAANLARVKGPGRVPFLHGDEVSGCPAMTDRCREKAYLVTGDTVVVRPKSREAGVGLACVDYTDARGRSHRNWIPRTALSPVPAVSAPLTSWAGTWRRPETIIRARAGRSPGTFMLVGQSTWGASDRARAAMGAINVGDIAAQITPKNDRAAFAMGDIGMRGAIAIKDFGGNSTVFIPYAAAGADNCAVRTRRLGPYLLVRDNNRCGGLNVSFSGVYSRQTR